MNLAGRTPAGKFNCDRAVHPFHKYHRRVSPRTVRAEALRSSPRSILVSDSGIVNKSTMSRKFRGVIRVNHDVIMQAAEELEISETSSSGAEQAAEKGLSSERYQENSVIGTLERLHSFVSGHDFSRAVNRKVIRALAPATISSTDRKIPAAAKAGSIFNDRTYGLKAIPDTKQSFSAGCKALEDFRALTARLRQKQDGYISSRYCQRSFSSRKRPLCGIHRSHTFPVSALKSRPDTKPDFPASCTALTINLSSRPERRREFLQRMAAGGAAFAEPYERAAATLRFGIVSSETG